MSEVKIHKKRESYLYSGFKPEGAPDFYEVEYVLKSDYDDLKNKLAQYESGDLPTWKSEHDILKEVCDSLDKSNQELQKDLEIVRDSHRRQCQLNDALYLKQIQLENQNEDLKSKLEKAESVISFYANKRHWDYTRIQKVEDMEMHGFGNLGGLKAREYLKGEE